MAFPWHEHDAELKRMITVGASAGTLRAWLRAKGADPGRDALRHWLARQALRPLPPHAASTPPPQQPATMPRELVPPEPPPDHDVSVAGIPRRVLTLADVHVPIHDQHAVDAVIAFARDIRPDAIVINGDFIDCWLISSFDHTPERLFSPGARLQEELDAASPILAALSSTCSTLYYVPGNHERRLQRLVTAHPGLFGLNALAWSALLRAPPNVRFCDYGAQLRIGPVTWVHGDRVISDRAVHLAHLFLLKYLGRNIVFAHHHRDQRMHRTVPDEHGRPHVYGAQGVGHLTRAECHREYIVDPSWQSGVLVTDYWRGPRGDTRFTHHPVLLIDGMLEWDGRLYGRGLVQ